MRKHINWDIVVSIASWGIVIVLFYGVGLLIATPPTAGPIVSLMGTLGVQIVFGIIYGLEAALLAFAKLTKRDNLRRYVLLSIYLVGFFTTILGLLIGGPLDRVIKNFLLSALAAVCWLHWTFKTQYVPYDVAEEER